MLALLLAGALAACESPSPESGAEGVPADPPAGPVWAIAPEGDLNAFFDCLEAAGATLVSAHRGGPYPGYPENAVETMEALLKDVPAIMEVDVATSADGVLYLMHDDALERATTGAGPVDGISWNAVRQLRLKDNDGAETPYAPTRFDAALRWAKDRTILGIDIKRSARFEDVAGEIKRQHAEHRVILIATSRAAAVKLRRLAPDVMIALKLGSQSELNRAVAAGLPRRGLIAFAGAKNPEPRLYASFDSQGVETIFPTLGGAGSIDAEIAQSGAEARYSELASMGVDIIATDRPRAAQAALVAAGRGASDGVCGVSNRGA